MYSQKIKVGRLPYLSLLGDLPLQHVELHNGDLDHVRQLTRSKHEAYDGEDNRGPIVQGRLVTHRTGGKHGDEEDLWW
jgi:hypothetical protein